jgi:hypothetical protein
MAGKTRPKKELLEEKNSISTEVASCENKVARA